MKALLYCTKTKPRLIKGKHEFYTTDVRKDFITPFQFENTLNGYIVAECDIDKVTENDLVFDCRFNKQSQMYINEMIEYVGDKNYYCLHLSNVKVFDEPKELSDYCKLENEQYAYLDWQGYHSRLREKELKKAPQNMMVVYEKNITINHLGDFPNHKYVLISIKPEWICKILNGEKTIEVRKQILNCLKEMV